MTKAELIRKLARRVGVPDSEAKVFFEIFLQSVSSLLHPGEAINIKNFGFFQVRKGIVRKDLQPEVEQDRVYSDLIVYTPLDKIVNTPGEVLIFNVPELKQPDYNSIDSYFSLSVGKPVIPLRGVKNTEFFIPPTGNELRRLLESKVQNLLSNSELIKDYIKGNEFLIIHPESLTSDQIEFKWNDLAEKNDAEIYRRDSENIPWDFGEHISKEIEEESLLDIEKDNLISEILEDEKITWDFGEEVVEEHTLENYEPEVEQELPPHKQAEDLRNFKRVKSFTRDFTSNKRGGFITRSEEDLSWSFGETPLPESEDTERVIADDNDIYSNYDSVVTDENGFIEVKNKRKTYDIELSRHDQERLDSLIREESDDDMETSDPTEGFYKDEYEKEDNASVTLTSEKRYSAPDRQPEFYSRRKSTPVFFIALTVIVLVGAALFVYLRDGGLLNRNSEKNESPKVAASGSPVVINRTYEIPVTYPYPKTENTSQQPEAVNRAGLDAGLNEQGTEEHNISSNNSSSTISTGSIKIKDNLYKEGDTYSVQVSAWKSKNKAERESEKLRNKGLNSVVERVAITGRGTWYRVKLINFKTQSEAEKYLVQN